MFLAKVYVTYKESILDIKGEAVLKSIRQLDYDGVESVRIGKYFEVVIEAATKEAAEEKIDSIADQLLANVTMETYRFEVEEIK